METGDGAAGYGDKHEGPDRRPAGMHVVEIVPDFRDRVSAVREDADDNTYCHDDQTDAEQRIDPSYDLINGDEGRDEIISKDDPQPDFLLCEDTGTAVIGDQGDNQTGRSYRENGTHHDQKHDAEDTHNVLHQASKINAADLGNRYAVISLRKHTGEIVVHAACENSAEGDPEEYDRSPEGALHGSEDRAKTGDIQKLDEKQLPLRHDNVVHAVINTDSRSLPVIRCEGIIHDFAIDEISSD